MKPSSPEQAHEDFATKRERALGIDIRASMCGECASPGRTPERHAATAHRARPDVMSGAGRSREKSRRLINDNYLRGQGRRYHFQSSPWTQFKTHGEMMGEAIVQFISAQPVLRTSKPSSKFGSRGRRITGNGGSAVSRAADRPAWFVILELRRAA